MIISKTPFRVSFVGGGTDFEDYYKQSLGEVISTAIDKYIYVTVNHRFDGKVHLRYSDIEEVDSIDELQHSLVREALRIVGISQGVEVVTISDVPTKGSGLGSSSALAVGLLNALYAFKGHRASPEVLAQQACKLEIEILGAPIGRQDQHSVSYGGFNHFIFNCDGSITRDDLLLTANYERVKWLERNSLLFYLGYTRSANGILEEHRKNIAENRKWLDAMKLLVSDFKHWLQDGMCDHSVGSIISAGWEYKRKMTSKSTSLEIEDIFSRALGVGAVGGKVVGAGGGGFLLLICERDQQHAVRQELRELKELEFQFEEQGSRIIYNG